MERFRLKQWLFHQHCAGPRGQNPWVLTPIRSRVGEFVMVVDLHGTDHLLL